jgi:hypothetical protein
MFGFLDTLFIQTIRLAFRPAAPAHLPAIACREGAYPRDESHEGEVFASPVDIKTCDAAIATAKIRAPDTTGTRAVSRQGPRQASLASRKSACGASPPSISTVSPLRSTRTSSPGALPTPRKRCDGPCGFIKVCASSVPWCACPTAVCSQMYPVRTAIPWLKTRSTMRGSDNDLRSKVAFSSIPTQAWAGPHVPLCVMGTTSPTSMSRWNSSHWLRNDGHCATGCW